MSLPSSALPCAKPYGACYPYVNFTCCYGQTCVYYGSYATCLSPPSMPPPSASDGLPVSELMIIGAASVAVAGAVLLMCLRGRCAARERLLEHHAEALLSTQEGLPPETFDSAIHIKSLGRGSSGVVSLMRLGSDEPGAAGPHVVRKLLSFDDADTRSSLSEQPDLLYEMWHEVRMLSQMSHPNIIKYLHARRLESELHIYMEYADNGNLSSAIKKQHGAPFATSQVTDWLRQLASALEHVHSREVLHRDLKTANVFLTSAGQVKLGDFGVARPLSTYTHFASTMVGTPYYLAPEVLRSSPYAFAADVWSLGVILFELLTLSKPFESQHLGALVRKVEHGEYDANALSRCAHPPELKRLASHECLLHPDPDERMRLDELMRYVGPVNASVHSRTPRAPATPPSGPPLATPAAPQEQAPSAADHIERALETHVEEPQEP